MNNSTASEPLLSVSLVCLRGGLAVRLEAIRLLLDLEARGVELVRDGADILIARGGPIVTAEDRQRLRQLKGHALAIIDYCAQGHPQ